MRIYVKFPDDAVTQSFEVESVEFPDKVIVEVDASSSLVVREPGCEVAH